MVQGHLQRQLIAALLLFWLVGCVPPRDAETDPGEELPAVQSLVDSAHAAHEAGRLDDAAATLERALRLQPENAMLWHELALVRRDQGEWSQAISSAQRSNVSAGQELQKANWLLIGACRRALGDEEGALEAERRAAEGF